MNTRLLADIHELGGILEASWPLHDTGPIVAEAAPGQAPATFAPEAAPQQGAPPAADPAAQQPTQPDPAQDPRIVEHVQQTQQQIAQMLPAISQIQSALPAIEQIAQANQPPAEPDPVDAYLEQLAQQLEEGQGRNQQGQFAPQGQPEFDPQAFAQAVQQSAQRQVQELVQQQVNPLMEQLQGVQGTLKAQEVNALEQAFPQLQNQEVRTQVAQRAVVAADQLVSGLPPQVQDSVFDQLTSSPEFLRLQFFAHLGEQSAAAENPAGGAEPNVLESGAGASPAGQAGDEGDAIVAAQTRGGWNPGG